MTSSPEPIVRSDEELMRVYQSGDREAFGELYQRYARPIYNFLRRAAPRPDAADDLCQKTFLKLHIGRHRYQPRAPFRYWIFTIARNVLRDEARERRRKPTTDLGALDRHGNTAVESSRHDTMDVGLMVTEALAALPLHQREVIVLNRYQGMNYGEIGEVLGISENAARQRAFQAMHALRRRLRGIEHPLG